jgi:hypothetical protein
VRGEEQFEQYPRIDRAGPLDELEQLPEPGEQQQNEGNRCEDALKGQGARQKRDAVVVRGLERPPDETPD